MVLDVNANLHLHVFSHAGSIFRMALIKSKWFLPVSSAISSDVMCWLSFPTCVVFFIEINVVIIILSCFLREEGRILWPFTREHLPRFNSWFILLFLCRPCLHSFCRASPATSFAGSACLLYAAKAAGSQLTLPSLTIREGLDLPPAPSLSREGSN